MFNVTAPIFPDYSVSSGSRYSTIILPEFSGMLITDGPYGSVSEEGESEGKTHAVSEDSVSEEIFIRSVSWIIENAKGIRKSLFPALLEQYEECREDMNDWVDEDDSEEVLPEIQTAEDPSKLCGLVAFYIGGIGADGLPHYGIELGCMWEEEHGAGVRFHGLEVKESGGADVAFTFRGL